LCSIRLVFGNTVATKVTIDYAADYQLSQKKILEVLKLLKRLLNLSLFFVLIATKLDVDSL